MPVFVVHAVDVHRAQGEADVDDHEDEEEDEDVHDHVAHRDDDRSDLAVHQPDLEEKAWPERISYKDFPAEKFQIETAPRHVITCWITS